MTKYGIIGAMDVEVQALVQAMESPAGSAGRHTSVAGMEFVEGTIGNASCVVVQCGVGMVNAAACTQALADRFAVDAVVNTGVAGSLDAQLDIGDLVVATDAVPWLMDVCNLGYAPGQTPGMEQLFPTDAVLSARIEAMALQIGATVRRGRVASGDRFVRDGADKERIAQLFGACCCEMEGAAIAQICWRNRIPCAIVRAISDKADGTDAMDYPLFEAQAAKDCANLVTALLRAE